MLAYSTTVTLGPDPANHLRTNISESTHVHLCNQNETRCVQCSSRDIHAADHGEVSTFLRGSRAVPCRALPCRRCDPQTRAAFMYVRMALIHTHRGLGQHAVGGGDAQYASHCNIDAKHYQIPASLMAGNRRESHMSAATNFCITRARAQHTHARVRS